jgi:phenylpropionate dioxygenase-like ring-hydroxylating dioxygenase large terminal subunit
VSPGEETGVLNREAPRAAPRPASAPADPARPAGAPLPRLSGDIRHLIPKLGLRNYWYPALNARRVGARKPVKVSMLGEDLCLFRGATGDVVAIQDICPHRGARLSEGACHYRGTVACPYHGWVFDESGKNVAVLSEGPDSGVCGKPGTEAKIYPTRTLKGVVFVWIGEDEPAPIEEDVPEEFFDDAALILTGQVTWRCNWEVALENSMDSHVNYVHRNALVVARTGFIARGAQGEHPIFVGNGFGGDVAESNYLRRNPAFDVYANGWRWPKTNYRRVWTWLLRPLAERARRQIPPPRTARWCSGHHLPGMFRAEFAYDLYTRMCVPVEENLTRVWYYHYLRPKSALQRSWQRLLYFALRRWVIEYNFSRQDERVMLNQRYDTPEKLSATDAEVIQWRRLVVTKHLGGRRARFEYRNPDGLAPDEVPVARVSVRYLQEQARAQAEARPRVVTG